MERVKTEVIKGGILKGLRAIRREEDEHKIRYELPETGTLLTVFKSEKKK